MSDSPKGVRTSVAEAKELIAELTGVLKAIDPNVPLRVSGQYALSSLGINVLLGLEALNCGGSCQGGCGGCEGCRGCKGGATNVCTFGDERINPDPTRISRLALRIA